MSDEKDSPDRRYPAKQPWRLEPNRPIIVFLTVCTKERRPILANHETHQLLLAAWKQADLWSVGHYMILPDHIHLFAAPVEVESPDAKRWVAYWKSTVSRSWTQEKEKPIWQRDVWDRQLRSGDSYREKWDYVRNNPVRHGLVSHAEDWPYQGSLHELTWFG